MGDINTSFSSGTNGSSPDDCCTWTEDAFGAVPALNCPGPGLISVDGSVYYSFTTCAMGTVTATLDNTECSDAAGSQMWFISGCNGTVMGGQCSNNGTMADVTLSYGLFTPGTTYYVMVDSYASNACNFNLTMTGPVCVLPIELINYYAEKVDNNKVTLHWTTASELNNKEFIIERAQELVNSSDLNFEEIARVPGGGNTYTQIKYEYTDVINNVNSNLYYYRLSQVDNDGSKKDMAVATARFKHNKQLNILSLTNTAPGLLSFEYIVNTSASKLDFELYNVMGQKVFSKQYGNQSESKHSEQLDIHSLKADIYYYSVFYNNEFYSGKVSVF